MDNVRASTSLSTTNGNTEVFVRILPDPKFELEHFKIKDDKKNMYVRCWQDFSKGKESMVPSYLLYQTDGIFYQTSQETLYNSIINEDIYKKLIYGNNVLVVAFGQTGSGKTVTTSGLQSTFLDRGLTPRILEKLFEYKAEMAETYKIGFKMCIVETNRNYMINLLSNDAQIYDMNTYKNIKSIKISDLQHGMKMFFKAEARKSVRENGNYKSNLGNVIVTITVFTKGHNTATSAGTLHIVDLAGIDTIGNASCSHKNGYEVGNGNLAKSQIEQLVLVINENFTKNAEIKQRLCIIVHYLRDAINCSSLVRAITHIRANPNDLKICSSILRLGCSFKRMVPKKLNRFLETSVEVQYQVVLEELNNLKKEMDLNAMLCDEDMTYSLSDERLDYIKRLAMEYLVEDKSELVLLSTTDTVFILKLIKSLYQKALEENNNIRKTIEVREVESVEGASHRLTSFRLMPSSTRQSAHSKTNEAKSFSFMPSFNSVKSQDSKLKRNSKKQANQSKAKFADIVSTDSLNRENISGPSIKSKTSKISKRKRTQSYKEVEMEGEASEPLMKLPDKIPSTIAAWEQFKNEQDARIGAIQQNITIYDEEIEKITKDYNKEVHFLEELKTLASARRSELSHAVMIKDLDRRSASKSMDFCEFQEACAKNSKSADQKVVDQKEKLLTMQAELRLNLSYKSKLQEKIQKRFNQFCFETFGMLITDLQYDLCLLGKHESHESEKQNYKDHGVIEMDEMEPTEIDNYVCSNHVKFEMLKDYMKKERVRYAKWKLKNRCWVSHFNVRPSCRNKNSFD